MHDDDRIRILHMIDAAQAVEQFIRGKKREDLDADRLLLFAVLTPTWFGERRPRRFRRSTVRCGNSYHRRRYVPCWANPGSDPGAYVPSGGTGVPSIVRRSRKWDSVSLSMKYT